MNEPTIGNRRDTGGERPVGIGVRGWLRWAWRQLTSMRIAIILLLILVVAMIPASILPQRYADPTLVEAWKSRNEPWGTILDTLGLFDVLSTPWFAAIYLLLFISLLGCIIPRSVTLVQRIRSGPGRVPASLDRYTSQTIPWEGSAEDAYGGLESGLRGYRSVRRDGGLSATTGIIREAGNLIFHVCLLALLIVFGLSQALSYRGQAIIVEGGTFTNSVLAFDTFERGAFLSEESLDPYRITLESMNTTFGEDGAPAGFSADVTVERGGGGQPHTISPNNPLTIDGTNVYLSGNGYAPKIRVTDASGSVVFDDYVVFPDITSDYVSTGVVKVPDTTDREAQLGLQGTLFPTARFDGETVVSIFPDALNPVIVFTTWVGDLGLDEGIPENVYLMNTQNMELVRDGQGLGVLTTVPLGQEVELPDGLGTVEFSDIARFAALDLRYDPTLGWMLGFALAGLAGIAASLLLPERRIWARLDNGELTVAGMGRKHDDGVARVISRTLDSLKKEA